MQNQALHIVCPHCDSVNRVPQARLGEGPKCGKCGNPLFTARPIHLGNHNFQKHITRNDIPVLVDFWAPWCGPCRIMEPGMEQAAAKFEPNLRVAKLNTDEVGQVAAGLGIQGIPTVILFMNGRQVARQTGAMDPTTLFRWINANLPVTS